MNSDSRMDTIRRIMLDFADRTGLTYHAPPRRYLWTDAFAVGNFLELHRRTGQGPFLDLALKLVDQVHFVLGRHRPDDTRKGWISGLSESEGRAHPTRGGLRIGKPLKERQPDEPYDDRLEWDRDGQYFHYLTKWMQALCLVARTTGDTLYGIWAAELARAAHAGFAPPPRHRHKKRLYWKMSIDLSRPLVASMGPHDPLDGLLTCRQIQAVGSELPGSAAIPDLSAELHDFVGICLGLRWETDDLLGLGELLTDSLRAARLTLNGPVEPTGLLQTLLDGALAGLRSLSATESLNWTAEYRLAFREFGLSIGLKAAPKLKALIEQNAPHFPDPRRLLARIEDLLRFLPLAEAIEAFWLDSNHQASPTWKDHQDINAVMLATSLMPE